MLKRGTNIQTRSNIILTVVVILCGFVIVSLIETDEGLLITVGKRHRLWMDGD